LTFTAWTIFYQAYPNQPELSHRFRVGPKESTTQWPSIVESLKVFEGSVLTNFCAYGIDLNLSHLMSLTDIPTLATLLMFPRTAWKSIEGLTARDFRDWGRAVQEKGAFKRLKLLFMCECEPTNTEILRHLTSFPALNLVGIARASRIVDSIGDLDGWQHPATNAEDRYTATIWDLSRFTIAQQAEKLYGYTDKMSLPEREDRTTITLSMTCGMGGISLQNGKTTWFVRDPDSTEIQLKRSAETQTPQDGSNHTMKKRKVRQGKQKDIGSLLGTFG
jgi:hypothetical protein